MNSVLALSAATTVVFILAAAPALASSAGTGEKEPHATAALHNPLDNQYALGNLKPSSPKFDDNDRETSRRGEVGRKHADGLQKGMLEKPPSFLQRRSALGGLELTHRG